MMMVKRGRRAPSCPRASFYGRPPGGAVSLTKVQVNGRFEKKRTSGILGLKNLDIFRLEVELRG